MGEIILADVGQLVLVELDPMTMYLVGHLDDFIDIGLHQQFILIGLTAASHHKHLDVFLYRLLLPQLAARHLLPLHIGLHPQVDQDGVKEDLVG